jgi:protein SERAC1
VVEQALLIARGAAEQHLKDILGSAAAIAFIGTPHCGSTGADWATPLTRLSNVLRKTNSQIVQVLKPGSEMLANLQQEFHTMLIDRTRNQKRTMDIFCFYEELPVTGIGKVSS